MVEFSRAAFEALRSEGITRAWEGLGGSHTLVTYPPLDALNPAPHEAVLPRLSAVQNVNLYVHVPFCEMRCAFCPYETHVISSSTGVVDTYLQALAKEIEVVAGNLSDAEVRSLYIGGGTATVLSGAQLERLVTGLRKAFRFSSDSLICVETSPNALIHDPAKIDLLRELGVGRVSVGVQTFSDGGLRREGRTHRAAETFEILEALMRQIEIVNIDLMQDMAGQTETDLGNDICQVSKLRPAQVTWYVERLRKWQGGFPDSYRSVVRRLEIRDQMKSLGYRPRPGGRFALPGRAEDTFKSVRCGLAADLVGLGPSAYSHVPGYFYRNLVNTADYTKTMLDGYVPIGSGVTLGKLDDLAGRLASGIRWGVGLDDGDGDAELQDYIGETKRRLDILMRHDLVRYDPARREYQVTLEGPGWAYEEEICSLFVPRSIVERIRARNLPWWFPPPANAGIQSTLAVLWFAHSMDALAMLL